MCCLRVFGCFQQSFPEGIIKSYEGTILTSGKVCCVQYLLVFRLISGYTGERLIPGLRQKDWVLRALLLTVTGLWPQSGEIYSARWKLILISDQFKDLVKNCFEGGGSMSPFQPLVYIRDLEQIDCVSREKFHLTIYVEKARVLRSNLTKLWFPPKSFIVWFTEGVDMNVVEFVLLENFVPSIKTLRECLVCAILP